MRESRHRNSEAGSAYIIALMVLVVLSLIGLGLALVGQTEVQIGANELTTHRALYSAENGIGLSLARKLVVNSTNAENAAEDTYRMIFVIPEAKQEMDGTVIDPGDLADGASKFGEAVEVSPMVRVQEVPCDLCAANEGGVQLVAVTYSMVSRADRIVWDGEARFDIKPFVPGAGESEPNPDWDKVMQAPRTATKQIFATKGIQPWWPSRPEGRDSDRETVRQELLDREQ